MVTTDLNLIIILVTLLHVVVLGVMVAIRLWPTGVSRSKRASTNVTPCAVCGEPATHRSYDGLDPDEQRDPQSGLIFSNDMSHYQPLCAAH